MPIAPAPPPRYTIVKIGTLPGGTGSSARAINDAGEVAGGATTARRLPGSLPGSDLRYNHGFLWDRGHMTDLGAMSSDDSYAYGINDKDQITGEADGAFVWQSGKMTALGGLGGFHAQGFAINTLGHVVGNADHGGHEHAFLYRDGRMADLGTLGGPSSMAGGINAQDQVAGTSDVPPPMGNTYSMPHAFLWQLGRMTDLGTLGGDSSQAGGINAAGQIVGSADVKGGATHAFVFAHGGMIDLGTLPHDTDSAATAINDAGVIVGYSSKGGLRGRRAVVCKGGTMTDLNTLLPPHSGWTLTQAQAINSSGQIIGDGERNGQEAAFLLTPR